VGVEANIIAHLFYIIFYYFSRYMLVSAAMLFPQQHGYMQHNNQAFKFM